MRRLHIDEREAESRIRQRAKDKQAKVKDIAQAIVDSDALLS
jgi:response regulator NasT